MRRAPRSKKLFVEMERVGKIKVQIWRSWIEGDAVVSQWGVKDGKMQETVDIPGPKGKEGTRAWISPEQSAFETLVRDVKTKAQKGYGITIEPSQGPLLTALNKELAEVTKGNRIDFNGPLPDNIAFSKPVNSVSPKKLMQLAARENEKGYGGPPVAYTLKKNGMCYLVSKDMHGDVWIQSRGKLIIENEKFPHLVAEFGEFLPDKSILLCEFYVGEGSTKADFKGMQKIGNSLPKVALQKQKQIGLVHAYIFRVPFWKGANMEECGLISGWLEFLNAMIDGWEDDSRPGGYQYGLSTYEFIHGPDIADCSYEEAMEELEEYGHEGWVVYDCWNKLGPNHISFLGQPDRPNVCWKVKRKLEDDFIAEWDPTGTPSHCSSKCHWDAAPKNDKCPACGRKLQTSGTWGTGKNKDRVGTLSLFQIAGNGIKQYICEVGSGLTDKQKQNIADNGFFIEVVQVGYQDRSYISRGDDSNALTHPTVLSYREDKELNECVNGEL
jgi:hypothetical protein